MVIMVTLSLVGHVLSQTGDYKIGIYCFYTKFTGSRSKNKDWLARIQANVWGDMSSRVSTLKIHLN
jgi:hypothetical protein